MIGSPVAWCHWKPSFTASKRLKPITPDRYAYDGLPSPSSVTATDWEVRGTTVQPEAKLLSLALWSHASLAEEADSPGGTRPPGSWPLTPLDGSMKLKWPPCGSSAWSPDRNQRASPHAMPRRGLSTWGDDQMLRGTLGGFATGVNVKTVPDTFLLLVTRTTDFPVRRLSPPRTGKSVVRPCNRIGALQLILRRPPPPCAVGEAVSGR